MKRRMFWLCIGLLVLATPVHAQTYGGFERWIDNLRLFFSSGDRQVTLALEIRERELASALSNFQAGNNASALKNLANAQNTLQQVQTRVSLSTVDAVKNSTVSVIQTLSNQSELSEDLAIHLLEEEKTYLAAQLIETTYEFCRKLATEDYYLMLQEERCNPETAPESLSKEMVQLKEIQEQAFIQLMLNIRSCIDDPGTCDCEHNVEPAQQARCEKMVALAVRCEYQDDENACQELEAIRPTPESGFAESFVPAFLRNMFRARENIINYDIEKSDVPEECYNENDRPECEQYRHMKETQARCWNKDGTFNEAECGGQEARTPTMQESTPQCYDEDGNFLKAKCGTITMVTNKEGLVNYIIETEITHIIETFENMSEQHTIDINGTLGQTENHQEQITVIEQQMEQIENRIVERVFAPGTRDTGSQTGTTVIESEGGSSGDSTSDVSTHVIEGGGDGSGGDLTPKVSTHVVEGRGDSSSGDLTPEVST
ncbi:MAG TPA: hypothetical protein ENN60_01865, partial [archaeon]|nr:hypothetical protein [archaeon]